jgi:hypothetical protein
MALPFKNFFQKQSINEPALDLDDPRWNNLEGGYKGSTYDASVALKQLEQAFTTKEAEAIYHELWDELHHQGDVSIASYYSVPHLVRIAQEKQWIDYNVFGLVSLIEIQRHKNNPALPTALTPVYKKALLDLGELAKAAMAVDWDLNLASSALTAIAIAKGQIKLANAIQNLDSEDVLDEFLENY